MGWSLLLDLRVLLGAALIAVGIYAKTQQLAKELCHAEFAQFRADVESEAAKAKVAAAQEAARHAQVAQETLDDLQTRYDALNARYGRLRSTAASSSSVPALSSAATSLPACSADASQPNAIARLLGEVESRVAAILEVGDRELAKHRALWEWAQKNQPVD